MSKDVKKPWNQLEDLALAEVVSAFGIQNWTLVSKELKKRFAVTCRSGKQCRERWHNHLNPSVKKTPWTSEEDQTLFKMYQKLGKTWSNIASFLPGRSDNSVKNRFYCTLRKKLRKFNKVRPHSQRIIGSARSILRDDRVIDFLLNLPSGQDDGKEVQSQINAKEVIVKPQVQKCLLALTVSGYVNDDSSLEDAKLLCFLSGRG
jgi:myb proto-oncogene protein/myb-related protein